MKEDQVGQTICHRQHQHEKNGECRTCDDKRNPAAQWSLQLYPKGCRKWEAEIRPARCPWP